MSYTHHKFWLIMGVNDGLAVLFHYIDIVHFPRPALCSINTYYEL